MIAWGMRFSSSQIVLIVAACKFGPMPMLTSCMRRWVSLRADLAILHVGIHLPTCWRHYHAQTTVFYFGLAVTLCFAADAQAGPRDCRRRTGGLPPALLIPTHPYYAPGVRAYPACRGIRDWCPGVLCAANVYVVPALVKPTYVPAPAGALTLPTGGPGSCQRSASAACSQQVGS